MYHEINTEQYHELRLIIDPWKRLGFKTYKNGTIYIGHVPQFGPEAYLHRLMAPLDPVNLIALQESIEVTFHSSLSDFLLLHNGIGLFRDNIGIYGLRTSYARNKMEEMAEQPYSMTSVNLYEFPDDIPRENLFVGHVGDGHNQVVMGPDGRISVWDHKSKTLSLPKYESILQFLVSEAKEAQKLFDSAGRRLPRNQ